VRSIVDDINKLDALRTEARHKKDSEKVSDMRPAVVVVDTAPEANERMTSYARQEVEDVARERGVCFFYVSPSEDSVVLPDVP
jgi:uncharacterized protein YegL